MRFDVCDVSENHLQICVFFPNGRAIMITAESDGGIIALRGEEYSQDTLTVGRILFQSAHILEGK